VSDDKSLEQAVLETIRSLAPDHPAEVRLTDRLREDLGLDSVASMELIGVLSSQFDVDIQIEEAMAVTDVQGILEMARNRVGKTGGPGEPRP
jgi:acyl carrier protein